MATTMTSRIQKHLLNSGAGIGHLVSAHSLASELSGTKPTFDELRLAAVALNTWARKGYFERVDPKVRGNKHTPQGKGFLARHRLLVDPDAIPVIEAGPDERRPRSDTGGTHSPVQFSLPIAGDAPPMTMAEPAPLPTKNGRALSLGGQMRELVTTLMEAAQALDLLAEKADEVQAKATLDDATDEELIAELAKRHPYVKR